MDIGNMDFPLVIVSDIAKSYINLLPKKYSKFHEANVFHQYNRFRCPSIVVQLRSTHEDNYNARVKSWKYYIHKCSPQNDTF